MKQLEIEGKADICFVVSSLLGQIGLPGPKNGLMSPDGVCAINTGPAGHETTHQPAQRTCFSCMKLIEYLTSKVH